MPKTNEGYNKPFAQRLRLLLDGRGVSQSALAQHLGVQQQTVSQYCNGLTSPSVDTFQKIAAFFEVSYDFLLGASINKSPVGGDIEQRLGMTDAAIQVSEHLKGIGMARPRDVIIGDPLFVEFVFRFDEYLHSIADHDSDDKTMFFKYELWLILMQMLNKHGQGVAGCAQKEREQ